MVNMQLISFNSAKGKKSRNMTMYKTRTKPKSHAYGNFKYQTAVKHATVATQPIQIRANSPS